MEGGKNPLSQDSVFIAGDNFFSLTWIQCLLLAGLAFHPFVTVHSASLSSREHVLPWGIYVVGIRWHRSSMVVH